MVDDGDSNEYEATRAGGWWQPADGGPPQPERRRHPRVPYSAVVTLIPDDLKHRRYRARDLSESGVLLASDAAQRLPVGQLVEVELDHEDKPAAIDAEVVRHTATGEFAVRFVNVSNQQRSFLRGLVREVRASQELDTVGSYSMADLDDSE